MSSEHHVSFGEVVGYSLITYVILCLIGVLGHSAWMNRPWRKD